MIVKVSGALKKLHMTKFHQAQTQQQEVKNKEKSNDWANVYKPYIFDIWV